MIALIPDATNEAIELIALAKPLAILDTNDAIVEAILLMMLAPKLMMLEITFAIHVVKFVNAVARFVAIAVAN